MAPGRVALNSNSAMARRPDRKSNDRNRQQAPVDTEFKDKLVHLNRVSKATKGGRTFSFAALVVVGDGKGRVGFGLGKARDVAECIQKANDSAKKNLVTIPVHNGTIPHEQLGKFGAGKVMIRPASAGTGVIAGGAMRPVFELGGVHDVLAKSQGSSNPQNVVKATLDALMKLRSPQTIAKQRGISVKQVFEG